MSDTPARTIPAPLINPQAKAFFDAAADAELFYHQCEACGQAHHPPRSFCPHCHSDRVLARTSSGMGTVYSASTLRRGTPVPYCIAYVTLDEGVTMMSDLIGFGDLTPAIGTRVQVQFVEAQGGAMVPMFGPVKSPQTTP